MLDFLRISTRVPKRGILEIYPSFIIKKSSDLMIRGGDFYAIWVEDRHLWSTDEQDAIQLIDRELDIFEKENEGHFEGTVRVLHMWDSESGMIDAWHRYCQKHMRDSFHPLDEKLIFSNFETCKKDYASRKLPYPLEEGDISAYEKLVSTLYSPEERHKIEWSIGSIVTGDSKTIQKFAVLYGPGGTGKSTILNIILKMFDGYCCVFDAKALGSANNSFALEAFKSNPLVAIQQDGDLSKIEDNTRLNSLVSHELMTVNEKFKSTYSNRFNCFLFMGTNKPVKITDAKSGLIRRLIDISPTGNLLSRKEYDTLKNQIQFELGAIANHCKEVYLENPGAYNNYIPNSMMEASNDFYNFVLEEYYTFEKEDSITLNAAWKMYKEYCDEARVPYPLTFRVFKEELKNYFVDYKDRINNEDGTRVRSVYSGFIADKFENKSNKERKEETKSNNWLIFNTATSFFDKIAGEYPAQYASEAGKPTEKWASNVVKLKDIDTTKLHYVKVPENHIVIDFDIPDENGNKSLEKNLEAASKWPPTYAELSKSGQGIHLHYIYSGDANKLSRVFDDHIEVKVPIGDSSLRRKLTLCNALDISVISSNLPLKGETKLVNFEAVKNEKVLRTCIKKNLNKEYHAATKPSIDFIFKLLEDAYNSGMHYDVSDLRNQVLIFANNSTHNAQYCVKLVSKMHFASEEPSLPEKETEENPRLVFFDSEVFPNLLLINWKYQGEGMPIVRMINPSMQEVEALTHMNLVGFNNRRYDNHILYARAFLNYSNEQLFELSQKIVDKRASKHFFGEAYNLSYTDILDYCKNKQSLKKWEIDLGIHHKELGLPWDQPVPEERWKEVAAYCDNDVLATEAVFNATQEDFMARKCLVDICHNLGLDACTNDTTNSLSAKIIFGNERKPQKEFNYRNLALPVPSSQYDIYREKFGPDYKFRVFDDHGLPQYRDYIPGEELPKGWSILPFFKGYKYEFGKSTFMGQEIGEGGRVFAKPGMYRLVLADDVASMHPHSATAEMIFGKNYTKRFQELIDGRVYIKHQDFESLKKIFNGAFVKYATPESAKGLSSALKIVINAVYGQSTASYENAFRDPNNVDNIIAKRGALFMTLLKSEVEKQGATVVHIKTDCIKIPNYSDSIHEFIVKFGKEFGYDFEIEGVYDRFALVNDSVYIAREKEEGWTAVGKQFAVPYVFKKLFSHEDICFNDLCETRSVTSALYLDMNEKLPEGEHDYRFVGKVGLFCPMKDGCGGGLLYRIADKNGVTAYDSVSGSKGYRWMESEMVKTLGFEDQIDRRYYDKQVDDAIAAISKFGDYEWFVSDGDDLPPFPLDDDLPF